VGGIEINREEYKIVKDNIEIACQEKIWIILFIGIKISVLKEMKFFDKVWGNEVVVGRQNYRRAHLENYVKK
jgi:two-component system alkaline phosphatase synthesis response regulator PhoP